MNSRKMPLACPALAFLFAALTLLPLQLRAADLRTPDHLATATDSLPKTAPQLQPQIAQLQQVIERLRVTASVSWPLIAAPYRITFEDIAPGGQTQDDRAYSQHTLPDHKCTPGPVMTRDMDTIWNTPARDRRSVSREVKLRAYAGYF